MGIPCKICGKVIHNRSALDVHMRVHAGQKAPDEAFVVITIDSIDCPGGGWSKCGKTYTSKEQLEFRDGEGYFCPSCGHKILDVDGSLNGTVNYEIKWK